MDKIVNKVVMLIQGQVYTIDDTTRIYTCTTDSVGTQQEIHNNRATRSTQQERQQRSCWARNSAVKCELTEKKASSSD